MSRLTNIIRHDESCQDKLTLSDMTKVKGPFIEAEHGLSQQTSKSWITPKLPQTFGYLVIRAIFWSIRKIKGKELLNYLERK